MFAPGSAENSLRFDLSPLAPLPYTEPDGLRTTISIHELNVPGKRIGVFVVVGQSNSANMSQTVNAAEEDHQFILDPLTGRLSKFREPVLGATGTGGTWLRQAGARMLALGMYDEIIWVSIGVGGTPVEYWATGSLSYLNHRILTACRRVQMLGLRVTSFIWHLGESAIGYTENQFRTPLDTVVATPGANGFFAPWIINISTYHNDVVNAGAVAAMQHIVDGVTCFAGANTDDLVKPAHRQDQGGAWVHYTAADCTTVGIRVGDAIAAAYVTGKLPFANG